MARANHEFLIENSLRYPSFYRLGLGQVERSEEDGPTIIRLFDPNELLRTLFTTIETIWPILGPEFNKKVKIDRIEIIPQQISNRIEFNFNKSPNALTIYFSIEHIENIQTIVDEVLAFYTDFLINDLFWIRIRNTKDVKWNPYSDGDVHIVGDLTRMIKTSLIKGCDNSDFLAEGTDQIFWVREILVGINNSVKYIPEDLVQMARKKYIELDFIMSS